MPKPAGQSVNQATTARTNGTDADPTNPSKKSPVSQTRIFMLRHADAKVMAQTLSESFGAGFGIAPDVNINAIIVRGDESQLKEVETIVELVDGKIGKKPAVEGRIPRFQTTSGESAWSVQKQTLTVDVDVPLVPAATVRSQIADLDRKIKETADSLRSTKSTSNQKTEYNAKRKADLREVVRKTFLARQELQRAELAEFAARLERIQQSIEMRERIADQIIDRRLEELLDPNVKSGSETTSKRNIQIKVDRSSSTTQQQQAKPTQSTTVRSTEVVDSRSADSAMILRSAEEFRNLLSDRASRVAQVKAKIARMKSTIKEMDDKLKSAELEESLNHLEDELAYVEGHLKFSRKEYHTQMQLLKLEFENSRAAVKTAEDALKIAASLSEVGALPRPEVDKFSQAVADQEYRQNRAQMLLELYDNAGAD